MLPDWLGFSHHGLGSMSAKTTLNQEKRRIVEVEDEIESSVDSRNDALPTLRELGPPDLVHLVKQSVKSSKKARTPLSAYHDATLKLPSSRDTQG